MREQINDTTASMFAELEEHYAGDWEEESTNWAAMGAIHQMVDMIPLKTDGIHVDFGSGLGPLLGILKLRCTAEGSNMQLLGVERNKALIDRCGNTLRDAGLQSLACGTSNNFVDAKQDPKVIHRTFNYDKQGFADANFLSDPEMIFLLLDDLRNGDVLRQVLGSRKLSSASFTFPGVGVDAAYEAPYRAEPIPDAEQRRRMIEAEDRLRRAVYKLCTELVEPGGILLVAERLSCPSADTLQQTVASFTRQVSVLMQSNSSEWTVGDTFCTEAPVTIASPLQWVADGSQNDHENRAAIGIYTRN